MTAPTATRRIAKRVLRGALWVLLGWVAVTSLCVLTMRWVDPVTSAFIVRDRFNAWHRDDTT